MLSIASDILRLPLVGLKARFERELRDPKAVQRRLFEKLIRNLSKTEYGRHYKIRPDDGYDAFAGKCPCVTYDELSGWVARQQRAEGNALVSEPVLFYEKTSGSSGSAKLIPYTRSLKASFNRMFLVWISDLLAHGLQFRTGKLFFSISPAFRRNEITAQGIRVGLDDDTEYLHRWLRYLLKPFLVVPPPVAQIQDPADFKRVLATLLAAEAGLEVISIWNPSLFEIILAYVEEHRDAIVSSLRKGVVVCDGLQLKLPPCGAARIALFEERSISWTQVWPELKLISCWKSAHAAAAAKKLEKKFPAVPLQGKGLLATEAPMTLPWTAASGFVPLLSEVFYEFLDDRGRLLLLHELEKDAEYEVILTQKGGLTRYRIGDRVRVTHRYQDTPCLEFTGRGDATCDLVGEKLNENFVRTCLEKIGMQASCHVLLPVIPEQGAPHYLLVADDLENGTRQVESELETELLQAYHYRNARLLGQLGPVRASIAPRLREAFYSHFEAKKMKWGDIKHCHLIKGKEDATDLISRLGNGSFGTSRQ